VSQLKKGEYKMPSKTAPLTMTVEDFLLRNLREAGIPHLFGMAVGQVRHDAP
jgi:hypothetical protein